MLPEALLKAIQMLSVDVSNLTTSLAMTKGQLEMAQQIAQGLNPQVWGQPETPEYAVPIVQLPMSQYQDILRLIDALS